MTARADEHKAWNEEHGLRDNHKLALVCPRCTNAHVETLTSVPTEDDYFHHVHQCTHCRLRFDIFVRTRATGDYPEEGAVFP